MSETIRCRKMKLSGDFGSECRCAMSWCDLDLTFDLAVVTLTFKIFILTFTKLTLFTLKVSASLNCFTFSVSHGVENYFPWLCGVGISDAIFTPWCPDGRAGGRKKFVWAVSQKP